MARYIDENDIYELFQPRGTARLHVSDIDVLPRADVAPRAEVAREIFEVIEKHLFVIAPIEEFDGWARIQLADIMRLKKKYTQPEPLNTNQ